MRGALLLAAVLPTSLSGAQSYDCAFQVHDNLASATLVENGDGFVFQDESGAGYMFEPIDGAPVGDWMHLASTDFDKDANAVALLTLASDGAARLSVHGFFPALDATSVVGSCARKDT